MAKALAVEDQQSSGGLERIKAQPRQFMEFLKDVRSEMRKVVTPSRKEVQVTTGVVIIATFLFGLFFFIVDFIFRVGVYGLLGKLGGLQ